MELLRVIERYQDRLCGICITIIILNKCVTFVHVYFFCKLKYSVSVLSIQRYHRKRMPWVVSSSTRVNGTKREPVKWWQPSARLKATPHNKGTIAHYSRICTHLRLVWFRKRIIIIMWSRSTLHCSFQARPARAVGSAVSRGGDVSIPSNLRHTVNHKQNGRSAHRVPRSAALDERHLGSTRSRHIQTVGEIQKGLFWQNYLNSHSSCLFNFDYQCMLIKSTLRFCDC